jgi:hypothetical protein
MAVIVQQWSYSLKLPFSYDPVLGIKRTFHGSEDGNTFVIQTEQDTTGIVEANKAAYNDAPERWGDMTRVASIPLSLYFDLKKKGITDDPVAMKRWLNDPDQRFFRTRPGTL